MMTPEGEVPPAMLVYELINTIINIDYYIYIYIPRIKDTQTWTLQEMKNVNNNQSSNTHHQIPIIKFFT